MVRVRHWRECSHARGSSGLAVAALVMLATGCKTGSWGAKPSWWSFGGSPPTSALTSAPSFDEDVQKPSDAAKPYPTTNTPEGYAIYETTQTDGKSLADSGSASPTLSPSSVTYGTTPPASPQSQAAYPPQAPPTTTAPASIGPQVGPYASVQPQPQVATQATVDPAAAATAGFAAAPAFGEATPPTQPPAADRYGPASRVADARGAESWGGSQPAAAAPVAAATGDSRYDQVPGSRFGSSGSTVPSAGFAPAAEFPAEAPPPMTPAATPWQPQPASPSPPSAGSESLPGSISPPTRRPDPGYRPGGTSSYRPNKAILAEEDQAGGVVPVSFESPPPGE